MIIVSPIASSTFHLSATGTGWQYCFHGDRCRVKVVKQKQEVNCECSLHSAANKPSPLCDRAAARLLYRMNFTKRKKTEPPGVNSHHKHEWTKKQQPITHLHQREMIDRAECSRRWWLVISKEDGNQHLKPDEENFRTRKYIGCKAEMITWLVNWQRNNSSLIYVLCFSHGV